MADGYYGGGAILQGFSGGMRNYADLLMRKEAVNLGKKDLAFRERQWEEGAPQREAQTEALNAQADLVRQTLENDKAATALFQNVMQRIQANPQEAYSQEMIDWAKANGTDLEGVPMSGTQVVGLAISEGLKLGVSIPAFEKVLSLGVQLMELPMKDAEYAVKTYENALAKTSAQALKRITEDEMADYEEQRKASKLGAVSKGRDIAAMASATRAGQPFQPTATHKYLAQKPAPAGATKTEAQKLQELMAMFQNVFGMDDQTAMETAMPFATGDISSYAGIYNTIKELGLFMPQDEQTDEIAEGIAKVLGLGGRWRPPVEDTGIPQPGGKPRQVPAPEGEKREINPNAGPLSQGVSLHGYEQFKQMWVQRGLQVAQERGLPYTQEQLEQNFDYLFDQEQAQGGR